MMIWMKAHGTTAGAIVIAVALTAVFGYIALHSWLGAVYPERLGTSFVRDAGSNTGGAAGNTSGIIAVAMSAVVLVSAIIIIGLVFLKSWARESAFVVYGALGLLVLAASIGGLAGNPPAPSAWTGILVGSANVAIVGLLMAPATARDFSGRPANRTLPERYPAS